MGRGIAVLAVVQESGLQVGRGIAVLAVSI